MAATFTGNTSTEASYVTPVAGFIKPFTLVNKSGGTIGVNVYKITTASDRISIVPFGLSLDAGEMYEATTTKVILPSEGIIIQTTGSLDYDVPITEKA